MNVDFQSGPKYSEESLVKRHLQKIFLKHLLFAVPLSFYPCSSTEMTYLRNFSFCQSENVIVLASFYLSYVYPLPRIYCTLMRKQSFEMFYGMWRKFICFQDILTHKHVAITFAPTDFQIKRIHVCFKDRHSSC